MHQYWQRQLLASDAPRYQPDAIKANWVMIDELTAFGNPRGLTPAQVALASKDEELIQIAITNTQKGAVVWMQPVSDEEYNGPSDRQKSK